ncbi:MAG: LOG family protein [Phycisphaerae bacterium]
MNKKTNDQPTAELRSRRDQAIEAFAREFLNGENQDLYQDMLVTLCRLARDGAERGDVKLIHKALAELRYGLKVFAPYREIRKITIYGSSRTPEGHPDYEAAVEFARKMSDSGWMVITGAGDGIMKAGHGGAGREASFGVAIRLPFEQTTNDIIAEDRKLVSFRYFFTRKLMFMKEASAVALFPGGFGTQDEGFEALTLVQTGKTALIPIIMCERPGGTYWPRWRAYVAAELLRTDMISEQDMDLFFITDSVDRALADVVQFYRVYHSSRYVGDDLVLRLRRPICGETLQRINEEFAAEILVRGKIEQCGPLPAEQGECPAMPRLKLWFDKKSFGRLRRMIDVVNRDGADE